MHKCWMYLPSQWEGQMTANSFVWCQTWTIKQCSEHFYFYWTGWEVSKRLYADFCVIRDENYKALYYTDSVDHLQLTCRLIWNGLNRAKQSSCICWDWVIFLHPWTSTTTLAASSHISNTFWNKHLHQDFPVAFACTLQFKHGNNIFFPGYRLDIPHFIYTLCKLCTD